MRLSIAYIIFISYLYPIDASVKDYAMSVAGLPELLKIEDLFINVLTNYTQELQLKIELIDSFLGYIRIQQNETLPEDPLSTFKLTRRLHEDWSFVEIYMNQPVAEEAVAEMKRLSQEVAPQWQDVQDAMGGIQRLQENYELHATNLSKGIIKGKEYDVQLSVLDTYTLAKFYEEKHQSELAIDWYQVTVDEFLKLQDAELYNEVYDLQDIKLYMDYSNYLKAQVHYEFCLNLLKQLEHLHVYLWETRRHVEETYQFIEKSPKYYKVPLSRGPAGCAGQYPIPNNASCYYDFKTTAFLTLAPLKVEPLNDRGEVVLYHNIIYDSDIEKLTSIDINLMKHDRYKGLNSMKSLTLFRDIQDTLNDRVMDMTGMSVGDDKNFQLMNFGIGGHIKAQNEPDTLHTIIHFFLSDVPLGGAIVFPYILIAAQVTKGAAILHHYDFFLNCPVLLGSKWTLQKRLYVSPHTMLKSNRCII